MAKVQVKSMNRIVKQKLIGELYVFGARNPGMLVRGFTKKVTQKDKKKVVAWMHRMARKYNVPYVEIHKVFNY